MHERLASVVAEHFEFEHYVDDHMRNIPRTRHGGSARAQAPPMTAIRDHTFPIPVGTPATESSTVR